MPAKPLTQEQLEDARRLKHAFSAYQARKAAEGKRPTQDEVAFALGFNQSALNQYLNGKIPLNADALMKFCRLMDEKPEAISPSIYRSEVEKSMAWAPVKARTEVDVSKKIGAEPPMPEEVLSAIAAAPAETRQQIENTIRLMLGMGPSGKQRAA